MKKFHKTSFIQHVEFELTDIHSQELHKKTDIVWYLSVSQRLKKDYYELLREINNYRKKDAIKQVDFFPLVFSF